MAQCAAATGIPLSALKNAKAHGCRAFRFGRVHFNEFTRWFFAQARTEDSRDWTRENKRLDALIKQVRLEEARKRVIDSATVKRFIEELTRYLFGELDRIGRELPPKIGERDESAISAQIITEIEKVRANLAAKLREKSLKKKTA